MPHVQLENAGLSFRVPQHGRISLKEYVIRRITAGGGLRRIEIRALDGVTLHIREGERVGVVGHNGAGKSSLLKLLAGIYPPTSGMRHVEGRISSLFDIALGFEPEVSGWENIRLRGYLQGETPASIRAKQQAIADFSELGDFLEVPTRCYSAGMLIRLAFSIATSVQPQILLVDETLSAGDMNFQQKARQRMRELIDQAQLLVMVSHDLKAIAEVCERVVWLDHGRIRRDGDPAAVLDEYEAHMKHGSAPAKAA
jgi:ABC-type polysaccharide/polyol phosphate transport system ATPase subunit